MRFEFIECAYSQEHVVIIVLARALQGRRLNNLRRQLAERLLGRVRSIVILYQGREGSCNCVGEVLAEQWRIHNRIVTETVAVSY